jgi:23S rRNA pseudouridine1911/1915/1917 synthase
MASPTNKPFKPDVIKEFTVESDAELMAFLASRLTDVKRTTLKQMLAHRQVRVGQSVVSQFNHPLVPGDVVAVNFTREFREFQHRRLRLVFEDDHVIVVHKGYGLLSMAGDGPKREQETAYSILRNYLKWKNPSNKLFIVHRLDRDTSGLMLFAKTVEAKEALQYNWNNMVLERKYVCVVDGVPEPAEGVVRSYLSENSRHEVYSTPEEVPGSKLAVTRYRTLAVARGMAMVECELDTGRKNQIRVHMKQLGTPIDGDRRYGGRASSIHRMALHAMSLRFVHPLTRRDMFFTSPIPSSFYHLVPR